VLFDWNNRLVWSAGKLVQSVRESQGFRPLNDAALDEIDPRFMSDFT
jgi:hypothetical protein